MSVQLPGAPAPTGTPAAPGAGQASLGDNDVKNIAFLLSKGVSHDKLPRSSAGLQAWADAYATVTTPAPATNNTTPPPLPVNGASGNKPDVLALTDAQKAAVIVDADGNPRMRIVDQSPGLIHWPSRQ